MFTRTLIAALCCICFFIGPAQCAERDNFDQEVECLATMIYHEARGEPELGQIAVGYTAINRTQSSYYPDSICDVVRQKSQYVGMQREQEPKKERKAWDKILDLATLMYVGMVKDPTRGALWFHEVSVLPKWATKKKVTLTVNAHRFYSDPLAYQVTSY